LRMADPLDPLSFPGAAASEPPLVRRSLERRSVALIRLKKAREWARGERRGPQKCHPWSGVGGGPKYNGSEHRKRSEEGSPDGLSGSRSLALDVARPAAVRLNIETHEEAEQHEVHHVAHEHNAGPAAHAALRVQDEGPRGAQPRVAH
jgi:hypothetical protein